MDQTEKSIASSHSRPERLFLHYFDIHFIEEKGKAATSTAFINEMRLATRIAVASADMVFIPAASYFESQLCRQIVGELNELISLGIIALSGSSPNLDYFVQERLNAAFYRKNSSQYDAYHSLLSQEGGIPPYMPRQRSATKDIVKHWNHLVQDDELQRMLRNAAGTSIPNLECRLELVPQELGGLAFIPEHVYEVLDLDKDENIVHMRIRSVINEGYFTSYVNDLNSGVVVDLSYLSSSFSIPSFGQNVSYRKMIRFLIESNRLKELNECTPDHLVRLGSDPSWQMALQSAVTYVGQPLLKSAPIDPRAPERSFELSRESDKEQTMTDQIPLTTPLQISPEQPRFSHSVLCLTGAAVEFNAVRVRLKETFGNENLVYLDNTRQYHAMEYLDSKSGTVWRLGGLSFQGEVEAMDGVHRYSTILHPTLILMVGMCMGMPKKELQIGTVVIPNEIFGFDHQRQTTKGSQHRPHGDRVDNGLYKLAKLIASDPDLKFTLVVDKALASASIKIEDINSTLVKQIEESFPDVVAFDMEGWGFYRAGEGQHCLWIKAVADSGEHQNQSASGRAEKQSIQSRVTDNATDFAILLVRNFVSASPVSS